MPLSAKLRDQRIYAFHFNAAEWEALRAEPVQMDCCDSKATLMRSPLGTQYFAHRTKRDCTSAGESPEHVYLKNLIAKAAMNLDWEVETEKRGQTPSGEEWIADVFCTKGKVKLAFEVQWSPQAPDEFRRRQAKYKASGVRAAWLFKLRSNKQYYYTDILYDHDVPVFGMKYKSKGVENLYIPQFNLSVEAFIEGMLQGKLKWNPKLGDRVRIGVIPHYDKCWRCKKKTNVIIGVSIEDSMGRKLKNLSYSDDGVLEMILKDESSQNLPKFRVGKIKKRYSKTREEKYLSNGCIHCDALAGEFFLNRVFFNYRGSGFPKPIYYFEHIFDGKILDLESGWYFNGERAEHYF